MTEQDVLEARILCLENENRALRETLRDKIFCAALTGLLQTEEFEYDSWGAVDRAWKLSDTAIDRR